MSGFPSSIFGGKRRSKDTSLRSGTTRSIGAQTARVGIRVVDADLADIVRDECHQWAEAALEAGWAVPAETLAVAVAGLDGPAALAARLTGQDLGR